MADQPTTTTDARLPAGNHLAHEKSPYLLQHAHQPVDWYPWAEGAFALARQEDKPVFLSIGYSTCHWCHVMARESFENAEVAGLMNEAFVSIKVDREERPDIDAVYMAVCQAMIGSGGWPLTIIMTPDQEPFFAATYIPKETRFGHVGMLELVPRVQEYWRSKRSEALATATRVTQKLRQSLAPVAGQELDETVLRLAHNHLASRFDARHGGFGSAPKFPTPHHLTFLLRYWRRAGNEKTLKMVEETLQAMRRGGIYDQVGGGFHRYSTDGRWLTPHFEKMLYDQALLALAYLEACQATGNDDYERTAREVFTYVLRDLAAPQGGFYSAEDADSEGREGKFYLWTEQEIDQVLETEESELVKALFSLKPEGNFSDEQTGRRTGQNVLYLARPLSATAAELRMPLLKLEERWQDVRARLLAYRETRPRPARDEKILTDWNGLMIAALARGAQVTGEQVYAAAARRAADYLLTSLRAPNGKLLHQAWDGEARVPAFLNDYAFVIWGLIELYETDFAAKWLRLAHELTETMLRDFWDEVHGGLFLSAREAEQLLVRQKEVYDGAVPSGNSVAFLNLLRLSRLTGEVRFEQRASELANSWAGRVRQFPAGHTQFLCGLDFALGPAQEVVVAGESFAPDTDAMLAAIRTNFLPNTVVLLVPAEQAHPEIVELAEFTRDMWLANDETTAYVCRHQVCQRPIINLGELMQALGVPGA